MSERDPFDSLGDLIDQPVAPDARFAADLKAQLMSGLSASGRIRSWEEEHRSLDIPYRPFPAALPAVPERRKRGRIRPLVIFEIAAAAALVIGIVAAITSNRFSDGPGGQSTIPAAALQGASAATPTAEPTVVPPARTMESTAVPPAGVLWQLPLPKGESLDSAA